MMWIMQHIAIPGGIPQELKLFLEPDSADFEAPIYLASYVSH